MPDRSKYRPDSHDRRSFPRPPLWLNLFLLVIAAASFGYAKHQRDVIQGKMAILLKPSAANPRELIRIRDELSQSDVSREQLARELDGRLQYLQSLNSTQFYISIDTARKKFYFRLGADVVRESDITIGEARTVTTPDKRKTWTFVPLKGSFAVASKESDYSWPIPEWVYAMRGQPPPAGGESVANGLGKYVLVLPDNYVIHTPPPPDSPLQGMAKPGSIMVPEETLAAIWPRITTQTRVYIF